MAGHFGGDGIGKGGKPLSVTAGIDVSGGEAQLLLGEGIAVVAATVDDAAHQFVAVGGDVRDLIAGIAQGVQHRDGGCGGVQPDGVADAGVFGGVVAEDQGDFLVGVVFQRQPGLLDCQPRRQVHPVGAGGVALQAAGQSAGFGFLLERNRHGY